MEIINYNTDTGNRDLSTEISFEPEVPFIDILNKAYSLKAKLIVKTSYFSKERPGKWYIKGINNKFSYDQIKFKLENNLREGKHPKRQSYLVNYKPLLEKNQKFEGIKQQHQGQLEKD